MPGPLDQQTTSAWMDRRIPGRPPLGIDVRTDVCIVGAGIAGLTTAYLLAREGKRVAVLEARRVGAGETGRTTAHLTNAIDDRFIEIERIHGVDASRLAAASHVAAIDRIERICRDERLECDFERVDGWLCLGPEHSPEFLREELEAAHRAGLDDVTWADRAPLEGGGPALRFPRQARFHPLRYLAGLAAAAERLGVAIYEETPVVEVEDGEPVQVKTSSGYTVEAADAVVATDTPINDRVVTHLKQSAYRSYVVALEVPRGGVADALFWDTSDPYHYVRLHLAGPGTTHDLLIVGGEDHRTGQADDGAERWSRLESWARSHFPGAGAVQYHWSGQVQETVDGLALVGRVPAQQRVYMITGDSGQGMTHATLGAIVITDLIMERDNAWSHVYDPGRLRVGSLRSFVADAANMAVQYADWIGPADAKSVADVPVGEGMVVRDGLKHYAVYRALDGTVHRCSAVCPHLGALVRWNSAEKSWDCPAHGSRFEPTGAALCGPASGGLNRE